MQVYTFNPLSDPRWSELCSSHPRASVFHTTGWLEALQRTYDYQPIGYTTSAPGETLKNGIVFCLISSWLTGRRMVSLPFADHCEPLIEDRESCEEIVSNLQRTLGGSKLRYVEIRPRSEDLPALARIEKAAQFCLHALDLRPPLKDLFLQLQKDCIQRKIRRAEREGLDYQRGRSKELLKKFYDLLLLTRRRHRLPPQPMKWFRNLISCLGDRVEIHVALRSEQPVASLLTLRHGQTLVYKYGCSDANFHNLGGMPFLFWKAIEGAKNQGLQEFDLGRSDLEDTGLIAFKDRLSARRSPLTYLRCVVIGRRSATPAYRTKIAKLFFGRLPSGLLPTVGSLLYKHIG